MHDPHAEVSGRTCLGNKPGNGTTGLAREQSVQIQFLLNAVLTPFQVAEHPATDAWPEETQFVARLQVGRIHRVAEEVAQHSRLVLAPFHGAGGWSRRTDVGPVVLQPTDLANGAQKMSDVVGVVVRFHPRSRRRAMGCWRCGLLPDVPDSMRGRLFPVY